jgi:HECT-like Ubiquitin-conjugating enzyme (E2)-binding
MNDVSTEGFRIFKSSLRVKPSSDGKWESFASEIFVSSHLISLIESSAARKFVVHSDEAKIGLLVNSITEFTVKQAAG